MFLCSCSSDFALHHTLTLTSHTVYIATHKQRNTKFSPFASALPKSTVQSYHISLSPAPLTATPNNCRHGFTNESRRVSPAGPPGCDRTKKRGGGGDSDIIREMFVLPRRPRVCGKQQLLRMCDPSTCMFLCVCLYVGVYACVP